MDSLNQTPTDLPFSNDQVNLTALPKIEDIVFQSIEANYYKVFYIKWLLIALGFIAACSVFWIVNSVVLAQLDQAPLVFQYLTETLLTAISIYLLLFGCFWWSLKKKGYALREHDVVFRQGIIATDILIIPFNRIQHIAIHSGLLSRWFGLATLQVFTAGNHVGDLSIPGLDLSMAQQMKEVVLRSIQKEPFVENRFEDEA